ncbi:tRNA (guanine(10)-N(2))-dimethyltransferase [Candidatus Bathyarchaeota archaeon]|nr:tRNA (guanine(10)-N(2))-dimethyltransferase [Candidatus Bathyarchaeota archaeon]
MSFWFPIEEVSEGNARILVPKLIQKNNEPIDHLRSRAAVFYNPNMRLNRDTAVLSLQYLKNKISKPIKICEPMCGSGVRGVRLALEAKAENIVMGDLNPSAVNLAVENINRNNVREKIRVRLMDANLLMNIHSNPMNRFDYIDVDPYGSPTPFLDSAIRSIKDEGLIALTATDMAPLCGVSPLACLRKYGGKPLKVSYSHEVALRLIIGASVKSAAIHEMSARPVLSYYIDHYGRVNLSMKYGAKNADSTISELGYIVHCQKCLHREIMKGPYLKISRKCNVCGNKMMVGGPMWLGELSDSCFLEEIQKHYSNSNIYCDPRLARLLHSLKEEVNAPITFYNIDEICSKINQSSTSLEKFIEKIKDSGFEAVRTHFNERGIKTNANILELENILKV